MSFKSVFSAAFLIFCFSSADDGQFFSIFLLSSVDDERFLSLFRFHPWMTDSFSRKSAIYYRFEQLFLEIFNLLSYLSRLFQKVDDLLPHLNDFSRFLHFVGRRRAVFNVFRSSLASETLFFAFSAFRLRATNDFQYFLTFPRAGKPIFIDFLFSLVRESQFSLLSCFPP